MEWHYAYTYYKLSTEMASIFSISIALLMLYRFANAQELFVCSSCGSNTNNGTFHFPLSTLNGARLAVKTYKSSRKFDNSTTTVTIRGGSYALWNSSLPQWVFDINDSGFDAQHPTIYQVFQYYSTNKGDVS